MNNRCLSMAKIGALSFILTLCPVHEAQAASFDCAKATTKVEKIICADAELSRLDEEMVETYKNAMKDESQAKPTKASQKVWLKERNRCEDVACVKKTYASRVQNLGALVNGNFPPVKAEAVSQQVSLPVKKPLYGHCVDQTDPNNCGDQSGKGYKVCETYLKYLNTLDKMPLCEVVVPPTFKRPDWEEMDVMQHLDWAYQAEVVAIGDNDWFLKDNPDALTWRKNFLAEIQAGTIIPAMRRTKVRPIVGGEEITILAYTRNRQGCLDLVQKKSKGSFWTRVGYTHSRIMDSPGSPLAEIQGAVGSMGDQTELLFYLGRPYFVEEYSPAGYDTPHIGIIAFYPHPAPWPTEQPYLVEHRCMFNAVHQKFILK